MPSNCGLGSCHIPVSMASSRDSPLQPQASCLSQKTLPTSGAAQSQPTDHPPTPPPRPFCGPGPTVVDATEHMDDSSSNSRLADDDTPDSQDTFASLLSHLGDTEDTSHSSTPSATGDTAHPSADNDVTMHPRRLKNKFSVKRSTRDLANKISVSLRTFNLRSPCDAVMLNACHQGAIFLVIRINRS